MPEWLGLAGTAECNIGRRPSSSQSAMQKEDTLADDAKNIVWVLGRMFLQTHLPVSPLAAYFRSELQ